MRFTVTYVCTDDLAKVKFLPALIDRQAIMTGLPMPWSGVNHPVSDLERVRLDPGIIASRPDGA